MSTPSLADGNEPLVLADGTKINPLTGRRMIAADSHAAPQGFVEVPSAGEAIAQVTRVRKSLADMPAPPKSMNAISVVCMYTMLGLVEEDIAISTGMTVEQIGRIKMLEAYGKVQQELTENILKADADDVRTLIAQQSKKAVSKIALALDSESEGARLIAAKDLLDRAGHRPADIVDHRISVNGGLRIEYVRRADPVDVNIEMGE